LSIRVKNADQTLHKRLTENHVITDWREPGVIRFVPVPFYNSFEDIFGMVAILKTLLD
jgi:kynureninase